jgi:hypothetical protein
MSDKITATFIPGANGGTPLGPVTATLITTGCPSACGPSSLADSSFANVVFTGVNGTITVQPAATVPEPSTLLLALSSRCWLWQWPSGGPKIRS